MIDFRSTRETRASSFDYIQVRIASPEEMRGPKDSKERERLEMAGPPHLLVVGRGFLKPETINYRSFSRRRRLVCERIFGPVRTGMPLLASTAHRYRGVICDRCGVEVT